MMAPRCMHKLILNFLTFLRHQKQKKLLQNMILYSKDETCSFKIERTIFIHQNNVESQYKIFLRGPVSERARII